MDDHTGFRHSAHADIAALKNLLHDRYSQRAVLKELLQNADDAGATELHFAHVAANQHADHALLRAPALLVLNNGIFEHRDAEGIRAFNVGTKVDNPGAIGKFGLGLKSVFHLCEALFYVASENQPAADGEPFLRILNPWADSGVHDDWNQIDDVAPAIAAALGEWAHALDPWFCLWIPLRTRSVLNEKYPIIDEYPEATTLLGSEAVAQLAETLPLTQTIERIIFWKPDANGSLQQASEIEFRASAARRSFPQIATNSDEPVWGQIVVKRAKAPDWTLDFHGIEKLAADSGFEELRQRGDWPARPTILQDGREVMQPEEARPHGAATLTRRPAENGQGSLTIAHAVFLPLDEPLKTIPSNAAVTHSLLLHGYFFLDSGRTHIERKRPCEREWNSRLEQRVILPLVLPALSEFRSHFDIPGEEVEALTRALAKSEYVRQNRDHICVAFNWILRLGDSSAAWELVSAAPPLLTVPGRGQERVAWDVFPALKGLATDRHVTFEDAPRIARAAPMSWVEADPAAFAHLISEIDPDSLQARDAFSYLLRFLVQEKDRAPATLWGQAAPDLIALGWRLLSSKHVVTLLEHDGLLKSFVNTLPAQFCLPLRSLPSVLKSASGRGAMVELAGQSLKWLPIPPSGSEAAQPIPSITIEDSSRVLAVLEEQLYKNHQKPRATASLSAMALELIAATAADQHERQHALGGFRVVRVYDCRSRSERLASWNDVASLRERRLLVLRRSPLSQFLQAALASDSLTELIDSQDAPASKILFGAAQVPTCDAAACLELLADAPALSDPPARRELLQKLVPTSTNSGDEHWKKAVRYLLHGESQCIDDLDSVLLCDEEGGTVWAKLARMAVQESGAGWQWIDASLVGVIPPQTAVALGLKKVGPSAAADLIEQHGAHWLDGKQLSPSERRQVLLELYDHEDAWRRLPIHETADGELCALGNGSPVFLEGELCVPAPLRASITLLRVPSDSATAALYRNRIPELDHERLLELMLSSADPSSMAQDALDTLSGLGEIPQSLLDKLRATPWLPTAAGPRSPSEIVDVPKIEEQLGRVLSSLSVTHRLVTPASLPEHVANHPGLKHHKSKLLCQGRAACEKLAQVLGQDPQYSLGPLPQQALAPDSIEHLLAAFQRIPADVLPAARFVTLVASAIRDKVAVRCLIEGLTGDIDSQRLKLCITALADSHSSEAPGEQDALLQAHDWYLKAFLEKALVHQVGLPAALEGLLLLNARHQWVPTSQLCVVSHGIAPRHTLAEHHVQLLAPFGLPRNALNERDTLPAGEAADQKPDTTPLAAYLCALEPAVSAPEVLGGFAAIFGDDESALELARRYLEPRFSVPMLRDRIPWDAAPGDAVAIGAGETIHDAMKMQRFRIRVRDGKSLQRISVINLLGRRIDAPVSKRFDDLLVGQIHYSAAEGHRVADLTLRSVSSEMLGDDSLSDLLRNTAEIILRKVFNQPAPNLIDIWAELTESEQVDIEVGQRLVLDHALFYLRQLDSGRAPRFADIVRKFEDIRYREAESDRAKKTSDRDKIFEDKRKLRGELAELLTKNAEAREEMLAAVRSKVSDFQYEPVSIPFELFQNADDAAAELRWMLSGEPIPSEATRMHIRWNTSRISFAHWGRRINQFRLAGFSGDKGRERGYHRDLEKMLIMSASDKTAEDGLVTGKFGLGFKSVFLFSDCPAVVSGRLAFRVLAGTYPQRLDGGEATELTSWNIALPDGGTQSHQAYTADCTVIDLRKSPSSKLDAPRVLSDFRELAHFVLLFSRAIKTIELSENGQAPQRLELHEERVTDGNRLYIGELHPSRASSQPAARALVIRGDKGAALVFRLSTRGIAAFPPGTPIFWVTAPVGPGGSTGFLINAPLLLDVGRCRLGSDERNRAVLGDFGHTIGSAMLEMFDLAAEWAQFSRKLRLRDGVSPYEFWLSLWERVAHDQLGQDGSEASLLRHALWSEDRGAHRLYTERDALPTGLAGKYRTLTRLGRITHAARGLLDDPGVFETASRLHSFAQLVKPGAIVSQSRVADRLTRFIGSSEAIAPLTISEVLGAEVNRGRDLDPERAAELGTLFSNEFEERLAAPARQRKEADAIEQAIREFRFRAQDGSFHPPEELLALTGSATSTEERMRAAFAPAGCVLSDDYDEGAIRFFRRCRSEMRASAQLLAAWALLANDPDRRGALLRYLVNGELSQTVADEVCRIAAPAWVESLRATDQWRALSEPHRLVVLGRLGFGEGAVAGPTFVPTKAHDPGVVLGKLYDWWQSHCSTELQAYNQRVYPDGGAFLNDLTADASTSMGTREAWLTLLLRGSLETLGWFSHEQHRAFLQLCLERHWIHDLAHGARPETLVEHIRGYVEHQSEGIPFFHWIGHYSRLFVMAWWLDDYKRSFLDVDYSDNPKLKTILAPRVNPDNSGGGPDAPPLGPMLGIGACFVLRELRRSATIANSKADPLCFVPGKAIRSLISEIGGPGIGDDLPLEDRSRSIWSFLRTYLDEDRATFEGAFDIPLEVLASRPEVRQACGLSS